MFSIGNVQYDNTLSLYSLGVFSVNYVMRTGIFCQNKSFINNFTWLQIHFGSLNVNLGIITKFLS